MAGITARGLPDIIAAYDFAGLNTIVDIGCGHGTFVAGPTLQAAGIADRCKIRGDFMTDLPTGADAYMRDNTVHGPKRCGGCPGLSGVQRGNEPAQRKRGVCIEEEPRRRRPGYRLYCCRETGSAIVEARRQAAGCNGGVTAEVCCAP